MCGILGSVNVDFEGNTLSLIKHRGPDFGKIDSYLLNDSKILFGHRRLSILDLSENGNQPMHDTNDRYAIIFNGEIYNHKELEAQLKDVVLKGHSDTEVLLNYLIQKGIEGVKELNGVFAFGFLDKFNQKLYLARDPFGVKPLYYFQKGNQFIFSSEIRPIKALIHSELDKEALAELLKLRYNPSEDTLYKEIKKVKPGHFLTFDLISHHLEVTPFMRQGVKKREMSLDVAVQQYGDLFEKAVNRQLMSDVELGVLLSGGIDSALVTYFAAKNSPNKIKSFTVGFQETDYANELEAARESATILNTNHIEVVLNQDDFKKTLEKIVDIVEEPLGTTSSIPMYFLNQEVAKHVKVVLTGQGADEPLGGYPRYKSEIYRQFVPPLVTEFSKPIIPLVKNEKIRRFIYAAGEKDIVHRFEKTYSLFNDNEIKKLIGTKDNRSYTKLNYYYQLTKGMRKNPAEAMMTMDLHMNLADDLLLYTDKISMHFGVEARVPILDLELIEFIESLPLKYKLNNGQAKFIHKEFAKSVLPNEIINRTKKGFLAPTNLWFKNELGLFIKDIMKDESEFSKIFDTKAVLAILDRHQKGFNQEKQLFLLLSLYYWFKKF